MEEGFLQNSQIFADVMLRLYMWMEEGFPQISQIYSDVMLRLYMWMEEGFPQNSQIYAEEMLNPVGIIYGKNDDVHCSQSPVGTQYGFHGGNTQTFNRVTDASPVRTN